MIYPLLPYPDPSVVIRICLYMSLSSSGVPDNLGSPLRSNPSDFSRILASAFDSFDSL